jgi:SAM-dependent methyltransferase
VNVDPYVQEWVAGTNGRLYVPLVHRLTRYPIPEWPLPGAGRGLVLDVGCGWGRWMVSAGRRGYVPVGIDVKLEPLQAARRVLHAHGMRGYVVLADLAWLPFRDGAFDLVFSYSAIQHVDRVRARRCVEGLHRVLRDGGTCLLELPNRFGLGRLLRLQLTRAADDADPESWCVRYYSPAELRALVGDVFGTCDLRVDSFFGIGVQRSDLDILPWRGKAVVVMSETLKALARWIPLLSRLADSVYVHAVRAGRAAGDRGSGRRSGLDAAQEARGQDEHRAVASRVICPASGGPVRLGEARHALRSEEAALPSPGIEGIPIVPPRAARRP